MQPAPKTHASLNLEFVGQRELGRYSLLVKLATGGMADIFLAKQRGAQGFEKLVVVKRILPSYVADPDFVGMFLDEGRLAGQLNHPNIVQTFDLGEDKGTYFIAMEYVNGESLAAMARAARLKGKFIDDRFAVRLISQAAQALDHAHRQTDVFGKPLNIVHRDVSPQNLLVTYDGQLKVVDFGIAKAANRATHTNQGQVKGKLSYMSPEQLMGEAVSGQADVFALGVVLFELVTGSRLVEGGDAALAVRVIGGEGPMPRASDRRPGIDARLDKIISKAMERDTLLRYQTGGEMQADLEAWLGNHPPLAPTEIADFLRELFEERIAERRRIIESALKGEFEARGELAVADAKSDPSMPDASGQVPAPFARPSGVWKWVAAAAVASGLGVGALVMLANAGAARAPKPDAVVEKPAPAPTPAPTPPPVAATPPAPSVAPAPAPAPVPAPVKPVEAAAQPKPAPTPTPMPAPKPALSKVALATRAGKAPKAKPGTLSLDSSPWTEVFFKGKSLGQTPLINVELPAGSQRLQLKNADEQIDQTIEIDIKSGESVTKRVRLK